MCMFVCVLCALEHSPKRIVQYLLMTTDNGTRQN